MHTLTGLFCLAAAGCILGQFREVTTLSICQRNISAWFLQARTNLCRSAAVDLEAAFNHNSNTCKVLTCKTKSRFELCKNIMHQCTSTLLLPCLQPCLQQCLQHGYEQSVQVTTKTKHREAQLVETGTTLCGSKPWVRSCKVAIEAFYGLTASPQEVSSLPP